MCQNYKATLHSRMCQDYKANLINHRCRRLWICIIRKITFMCETQTFKHTRKPYTHHFNTILWQQLLHTVVKSMWAQVSLCLWLFTIFPLGRSKMTRNAVTLNHSASIPSLLMLSKLFQNAAVNTDEIYSIQNVHDILKRHT